MMRSNPGYHAVQELQNKSVFPSVPQARETQSDASYFFITLTSENAPLKIAGKIYQPGQAPHVSIYEYYKKSETKGLSAFHYTWYGMIDENGVQTAVVLHVYFNCTGQYLYCQLKNNEPNEVIQHISVQEENAIKRHAQHHSGDVVGIILAHVKKCYTEADMLVTKSFSILENISQHIDTQLPKYKQEAKRCIEAMQKKNRWTFDHLDVREELLRDLIIAFEKKIENQQLPTQNGLSIYTPVTEKTEKSEHKNTEKNRSTIQTKSRQSNNKSIVAQPKPLSAELLEALKKIDSAIDFNETNKAISDTTRAVTKLELLNKKFSVLTQGDSGSIIEKQLIQVMQKINQHYQEISLLFAKKACEGDVEAITGLKSFVSFVSSKLFYELIVIGKVAVCEYIVKNFWACSYYLNRFCYGIVDENQRSDAMEKSFTLLQFVFAYHDDPRLLQVLLNNGADPNFYGATGKFEEGILYYSICNQKVELVRMLLENGADPNPKTGVVNQKTSPLTEKNMVSFAAYKKSIATLAKKEPSHSFTCDTPLLQTALLIGNKEIVTLLLEYGASPHSKNNKKLDALGSITCDSQFFPNIEMVELLLAHGVLIDTIQGEGGIQTTALTFACGRGHLSSVKEFIRLKADPNQEILNPIVLYYVEGKPVFDSALFTPFQIAAVQGRVEIVEFLIAHNPLLITFKTAATTVAYLASCDTSAQIQVYSDGLWSFSIQDPMVKLIMKFARNKEGYNEQVIAAEVRRAEGEGNNFYRGKKYERALVSFYEILIFGAESQFQSACFNIGCCYQMMKNRNSMNVQLAQSFFTVCMDYDSESKIGQLAATQLEKIQQASSLVSSIGFGKK